MIKTDIKEKQSNIITHQIWKTNRKKGITLIALVVTIVVLLILAGVVISLTVGNGGLFSRATNTVNKTDIVGTKEQIEIELMGHIGEGGNYTNNDVVASVLKVTGQEVELGQKTITTAKGNEVDIEDLWIVTDVTICKDQVINAINSIYWGDPKAIIVNKSTSLKTSIGSRLPAWYKLSIEKNSEGNYTITKIKEPDFSDDYTDVDVPTNGFILAVYDPQFDINSINLEDNEIKITFVDGTTTIDDCKTIKENGSTYATFEITSGMVITDYADLGLPEGEGDYLYSYYTKAEMELSNMTLEEKIAQMFVIGASNSYFSDLAQYKFGGYLFFEDSFTNKTIAQVSTEMEGYQTAVKELGGIPLLMSIDEEGATVSRLR